MEKTERNYGIDLLKIVLAIMVITIHINANGTGKVLQFSTVFPWKWITTIITMLCYPAVNTYIVITGYYSYQANKDFNNIIKSLSLLWLSALFFSLIGYLATVALFNKTFDIIQLIKRFFPIIRGVWWFYTVYFVLMLISPFLNRMIHCLSNKEMKLLLVIAILTMSVFPAFVGWNGRLGSDYGYSLIWFITLYITGAFLKQCNTISQNQKRGLICIICYVIATGIIILWPFVCGLAGIQSTMAMYNSIFCYAQSIFLFIAFGNLKVHNKMKKIVGKVSSVALASYLFHCQEDIEILLWNGIHPSSYANSILVIVISIIIILFVFCIACCLEIMRKKICKKIKIDDNFKMFIASIAAKLEDIL